MTEETTRFATDAEGRLVDRDLEMYCTLNVADWLGDGSVSQALNAFGNPNHTLCPECGVDDFCHAEGCTISVYVEGIVTTIVEHER